MERFVFLTFSITMVYGIWYKNAFEKGCTCVCVCVRVCACVYTHTHVHTRTRTIAKNHVSVKIEFSNVWKCTKYTISYDQTVDPIMENQKPKLECETNGELTENNNNLDILPVEIIRHVNEYMYEELDNQTIRTALNLYFGFQIHRREFEYWKQKRDQIIMRYGKIKH